MNTAPVSWVVYSRPVHRQDPMLAVCEQSEWEEIESGRPGVNTLVKSGFTSEGAAEQAARGEPEVASALWGRLRS
jgi:hypothetical protein